MLKKLFGGKKEFYVQLDDSQTAAPEVAKAESAPKPEAAVSEAPTPAKAPKTSAKKAAKAPVEAKTTATESTPVVAPKPQAKPTQVAFASADPIPQNIARRGPGPSLNKFKEMARQVKTR